MSKSQGTTLELNGANLYFEQHGAGEPVLLLHGFTGSSGDWVHAGRDTLARSFRLIAPDARGHGRSTNPLPALTHRQCALDALALLDHLRLPRIMAIGMSMGGNTLLHLATLTPERVTRMVIVSSTPYFPEQARRIMLAAAERTPGVEELATIRERHGQDEARLEALWRQHRVFAEDYTDMAFTPPALARIQAETLVIAGDRDPLYPLDLAVQVHQSIPRSALWIVPGGGHGPIYLGAAPSFVETARRFLTGGVDDLAGAGPS